eukprot:Pgem_evm1s6112
MHVSKSEGDVLDPKHVDNDHELSYDEDEDEEDDDYLPDYGSKRKGGDIDIKIIPGIIDNNDNDDNNNNTGSNKNKSMTKSKTLNELQTFFHTSARHPTSEKDVAHNKNSPKNVKKKREMERKAKQEESERRKSPKLDFKSVEGDGNTDSKFDNGYNKKKNDKEEKRLKELEKLEPRGRSGTMKRLSNNIRSKFYYDDSEDSSGGKNSNNYNNNNNNNSDNENSKFSKSHDSIHNIRINSPDGNYDDMESHRIEKRNTKVKRISKNFKEKHGDQSLDRERKSTLAKRISKTFLIEKKD